VSLTGISPCIYSLHKFDRLNIFNFRTSCIGLQTFVLKHCNTHLCISFFLLFLKFLAFSMAFEMTFDMKINIFVWQYIASLSLHISQNECTLKSSSLSLPSPKPNNWRQILKMELKAKPYQIKA
jgi:hypothetical protein